MGRKRDRFWEYAYEVDGRFKCKFCERDFAGSASRIKSHLAGVKGHDIDICIKVPKDIKEDANLAIGGPNKTLKTASSSSNGKESKTFSISLSTITNGSSKKTTKEKNVTQWKEEYMAENVISVFVEGLLPKLESLAAERISYKWGIREELMKLLLSLTKIQVVLHYAEKRQVRDESLMKCLAELRDIADAVDDLLDEFAYMALQQKVQTRDQMKKKVCATPSFSNLMSLPLEKIKNINQSLDRIKNGLDVGSTNKIPHISMDGETDSLIKDSEIVGRGCDVSTIVNMLTSASNHHLSILPIVGMTGLGKTTIAKLVYNHKLIRKHFDILAWVHVTKNFNVTRILSEILKYLGEDLIRLNDEVIILQKLQEKLWSNKYLLVLDDVWNEDSKKWDILKSCLSGMNSYPGNNIIVTTCSDNVAKIMGTLPKIYLEKLSKDECWSVFEKRAFANKRISPTLELEAIGREIAKRCGGVPWAARVLGGTMSFLDEKSEWLSIQNNKLWDLFDGDNDRVLSVLKLSFDYLPTPSLKQCFAYCAIFPKGCEFEKDKLIQLWMAEGFLEPFKDSCMVMEDIGNMYFNMLLEISFFQDSKRDEHGNIISCKIHDLVHDLAFSISKSENLILERDLKGDINHVQRLFARSDGQKVPKITLTKVGFTKLRTFISENMMSNGILSNFGRLRVLKLSGESILKLPDAMGQLIHMKLLDISHTKIFSLPKSITELYHLQTLRIENCPSLRELPENLSNLINLRHIYIDHDQIKRTPKDMGQLTSLQTLSFYVVDLNEGCRIEELGHANQLRGALDVYNLEHVRNKEEAKSANLSKKAKIFKLGFEWSPSNGEDRNNNDEDVLEGLRPHQNLRSLTIKHYGGQKFPSWMFTDGDARDGLLQFDNLTEITLHRCSKCKEVPSLGHLPCLRVLEIKGLDKVTDIGTEFYSDGSYRNALFPALRKFTLQQMHNLVEWKEASTADEVFPYLEELTIEDCEKLISAPCRFLSLKKLQISKIKSTAFENIISKLTTLVSLYIERVLELASLSAGQLLQNNRNLISLQILYCHELVQISPHEDVRASDTSFLSLKKLVVKNCSNLNSILDLRELRSLTELNISYCQKLIRLPMGFLDSLTRLNSLEIGGFCELDDFSSIQHGVSVKSLSLIGCTKLYSLPNEIQHFTALKYLTIHEFDRMEGLPDSLGNLSSIQLLSLSKCEKLMYLSTSQRCLTKLKSLYIKCCPRLEESYAKGSSAEWSKIAQIWPVKIVFLIHEERKAEWSKIPQIGTIKIVFLKHEEFEDRHYEDK